MNEVMGGFVFELIQLSSPLCNLFILPMLKWDLEVILRVYLSCSLGKRMILHIVHLMDSEDEKKEEKKGYVEVTEYSADAYAQATDALEDEELNDVVDIEKYEKQPVDEETERKGVENANKLNAILDSIEKKKGES